MFVAILVHPITNHKRTVEADAPTAQEAERRIKDYAATIGYDVESITSSPARKILASPDVQAN